MVATIAIGVSAWSNMPEHVSVSRDEQPERIVHGRESVNFSNVSQLIGTSAVIVKGTVLSAAPGRTLGSVDDGGTDQARDVTVRVNLILKGGGYNISTGADIVVEEWGWDQAGQAYQMENLSWSQAGDVGYFYLQPADQMITKWRYVNTQGRVLIKDGLVRSSADPVSPLFSAIDGRTNSDFCGEMKYWVDPSRGGTVVPQPVPATGEQQQQVPDDGVVEPEPDGSTNDGSEPTPYPSAP
ncbi:hypothetical protein ACFXGT_12695 [Streptomyces sp. NPDC059352]|uniref:hypothetical protein n=1 Tax=Streptomyces sp. NPDC059352 TaxID=3346810 RepID=UPI0036CE3D47